MKRRSITRRTAIGGAAGTVILAPRARGFMLRGMGSATVPPPPQTIAAINLSNQSFVQGSPDGTFVGLITVTMSPASPVYTGAVPTLGGTNAGDFRISGSSSPWSLVTNGVLSGASYSITLTATQAGIPNSPFTTSPIAITGITGVAPTYTLTNDAATATTAGIPSEEFGMVFAPGYLLPGHRVIFTDAVTGLPQPYSASPVNAIRYWGDDFPTISGASGSVMHMSFRLRPLASIPAGQSRTYNITTEVGAWPSATRTISDVHAQNFALVCPPFPGGAYVPTTTVGAYLTAANDTTATFTGMISGTTLTVSGVTGTISKYQRIVGVGVSQGTEITGGSGSSWTVRPSQTVGPVSMSCGNLAQTRLWLTGDAGETWCFTHEMSAGEGGAPEGQLLCNTYMTALTYAPGGTGTPELGGFRVSTDIRMPMINRDVPAKGIRVFGPSDGSAGSGMHWTAGGTPFVPNNWGQIPATMAVRTTAIPPTGRTATQDAVASVRWGLFNNCTITNGSGGAGHILSVNWPAYNYNWGSGYIYPGIIIADWNTHARLGVVVSQLTIQPGDPPFTGGTYELALDGGDIYQPTEIGCIFTSDSTIDMVDTVGGANPLLNGSSADSNVPNFACGARFTGASLPAPLDPNRVFWAQVYNSDSSNVGGVQMSIADFGQPFSSSGGVVGATTGITLAPCVLVQFGNRLYLADTNAEPQFFKGTGSITADTPLRPGQINLRYWVSTGAVPPWAVGGFGSVGPPYTDISWAKNTPFSTAPWPCQATNYTTGGLHAGVWNPIDGFLMKEFWNSNKASYRAAMYVAMSGGGSSLDLCDSLYPNVPINITANSGYAGMMPSAPNLSYNNFSSLGYTSSSSVINTGVPWPGTDHSPDKVIWATIRSRRLDIMDRQLNLANVILTWDTDTRTSPQLWTVGNDGVTHPTYIGAITGRFDQGSDRFRGGIHSLRSLGMAAAYYPWDPSGTNVPSGLTFDGSQTYQFLQDLLTVNYQLTLDMIDPANMVYGDATDYICNVMGQPGLGITPLGGSPTGYGIHGGYLLYMDGYWPAEAPFAYLSGNAAARGYLLRYGQWKANQISHTGGQICCGYGCYLGIGPRDYGDYRYVKTSGSTIMKSDNEAYYAGTNNWYDLLGTNQYIAYSYVAGTASPTNRLFSIINGFNSTYSWPVWMAGTDHGEFLAWGVVEGQDSAPPTGINQYQTYVVYDCINTGPNNWSFNLKDLSGNYVNLVDSGSGNLFSVKINSHSPATPGKAEWVGQTIEWSMFCNALGEQRNDAAMVAAWAPMLSDAISRWASSTGGQPTWALGIFGAGADVCFAYQPSFITP